MPKRASLLARRSQRRKKTSFLAPFSDRGSECALAPWRRMQFRLLVSSPWTAPVKAPVEPSDGGNQNVVRVIAIARGSQTALENGMEGSTTLKKCDPPWANENVKTHRIDRGDGRSGLATPFSNRASITQYVLTGSDCPKRSGEWRALRSISSFQGSSSHLASACRKGLRAGFARQRPAIEKKRDGRVPARNSGRTRRKGDRVGTSVGG
ncbi:hypothetical protein B0T16DRAFT_241087 [Cercophora newfieldiana]|uniref:Uncharacterized protein n=1 Tax=Cercophora newfieldiana TaxID=92897 RepID=A0AA40CJE7_9PEZI|nr:hypothetical protein B0T16DRAFT_241087 [Cercophora newfieldiana]